MTYQLLAALLRRLEAGGYQLGVDQHLRLQELIRRRPPEDPPERLKTVLAPLLTSSREEQQAFYDLFDETLAAVQALQQADDTPPATEEWAQGNRRWGTVALGLASILLLLLAGWWWLRQKAELARDHHYQSLTLYAGESRIIRGDTLLPGGQQAVFVATGRSDSLRTEGVFYELLDSLHLRLTPLDTIGQDSVVLMVYNTRGDSLRWEIHPVLATRDPGVTLIPVDTSRQLFQSRDLPFPEHDVLSLAIPEPTSWDRLIADWLPQLKVLALLLFAALLWAILRWRAFRRRKLVAELEQRNLPPYLWDIRFTEAVQIELGPEFSVLLNRLRRRTGAKGRSLDIPRTVDATIAQGGMADFRYRQQTRPPEYLLLIDRQSARNHQAQLFDLLYRAFLEEEVLISRYFYRGDPRLCFNEEHPDGIQLQDLAQHHPATRLLVVGSGYGLLSPLSGRTARWSRLLEHWPQRSLLTPLPTSRWGRRERQLGELLHVLPASPQSLDFLVDQLDAGQDADFNSWREKLTDTHAEPIALSGGLLESLRRYFDEHQLQWIAACAVYPKLHFELSCQLGQLLSTPARQLLTLDGLRQLNRLSWFVEGAMPEVVRALLIAYLEEEHPAVLLRVRQFLHATLQANTPPSDSVAATDHALQMALNEWLFTQNAARKKELERQIAGLLAAGAEADFTVVKYLEREQTPLDFIVPAAWKKYIHPTGYPALGWGDLRWALPLWLAALVAVIFYQPELPVACTGERATYRQQELCLETPEDYALYEEQLTLDLLITGDTAGLAARYQRHQDLKRETLITQDSLPPAFAEGDANIATTLYNVGVSAQLTDRDEACYYFGWALRFDSLNTDWRRPVNWCADAGRPIASFVVDQGACCVPCEIAFSNLSSEADAFVWDFGDGTRSTEPIPPGHSYQQAGDYVVILIARNEMGADTVAMPVEVVQCPEPGVGSQLTAQFLLRAAPTNNCIDAEHRFLNLTTFDSFAPFTYDWDFGDGSPVYQRQTGVHFFTSQGTYIVQLTVTNANGESDTYREEVKIEDCWGPGPEPPPSEVVVPEMITIPGGTFTMGCLEGRDTDCYDDEQPPHEVTLGGFGLSRYEVTNAEYAAFLNARGNQEEGGAEWINLSGSFLNERCRIQRQAGVFVVEAGYERHPVIYVSWYGARAYAAWLSEVTGQGYRLPTEAEWEYAARGGRRGLSDNFLYSGSDEIGEVAWYGESTGGTTHVVGQKRANQLDLYDMSGNVWEWCSDDWHGDYENAPTDGRAWVDSPRGANRVIRGGSCGNLARYCRVASRNGNDPTYRSDFVGFRLALSF